MCPTFTVCLSVPKSALFCARRIPGNSVSLVLLSVFGISQGDTLFSKKEEKSQAGQGPLGIGGRRGWAPGWVDGDGLPQGRAGWGAACLGSAGGPACISLHPETAELLCPVLGERWETFPEGLCCLYTCLLLHFADTPVQVRAKLGLSALCLSLPCWHALSLQVSWLFYKTQKIYFSSALSVSVFEVYLPRLQYIKHWKMGISRVQFRALKLAPALNCPLKVPVSFYWLQKVLTETSLLCLKLAFVKTLLCISYCNLYWNGGI